MANGLWSKLESRHANKTGNNAQNSNQSLLYQALLSSSDPKQGSGSSFFGDSSNVESLTKGVQGVGKLVNTLKTNNTDSSLSPIGTGINNYITGSNTSSGSAITDAINGVGGSGSATTDAINSVVNSGTGTAGNTGGFFSKFKGGNSGGGTPWALIGGLAKSGYNTISGHDDKEYSDLEEGVIYPLQGASMGAQFGPWGAAAGALYGLGYSFKDDLGMKDSNFLTQMLFPVGMGDGGGLRIGGKSILDLG